MNANAAGFGDFSFPGQKSENVNPRQNRNSGQGQGQGQGHARRHSLALPEAKKAAELAEQKRKSSAFQFPVPGATGAPSASPNRSVSPASAEQATPQPTDRTTPHARSQSMAVGGGRGRGGPVGFQFPAPAGTDNTPQTDFGRRASANTHGRTQSRNFDSNWRQPQPSQDQSFQMSGNSQQFQPGHRSRASYGGHQSMSSMSSLSGFQLPAQPHVMQMPQGQVLIQPNMFSGQQLNPLQLAQMQAYQSAGLQPPMMAMPGAQAGQINLQQQQQQRKTLFTPYLPQATLPALLADGQLVAGVLRVNKKNRSDAYVTTTDLDADIFICGSKDRNRALEGDLVAVELLDVDEVWVQKREKEEKKKRKDMGDTRNGSITAVNDATTAPESSAAEGGIRRRGSLKQRPVQKKNDDVEVEGQSLLLMEEDEINDEQKPLYAGHIVAVVERIAGQMFSGTLGLLRPSSQATKERQEAERGPRDNRQHDRQNERPKIVWFKPTDKRVPLIAIPTEQAPRDFVEKHAEYANKIFVACIKRWPITSLHPFGTLVEQLGDAGDLRVETDALLRDNNFGPDEFSDAIIKSVTLDDWSVANDGEAAIQDRRDFRSEKTFTIDPNGSDELDDAIHFKKLDNGRVEIGMHVADVAHFVKPSSLVDREARKRGTGVYLMNKTVDMLPKKLSADVCCLSPGEDRYTVSVVFQVDENGNVTDDDAWIGKSLIQSSGKLSYDEVDAAINGDDVTSLGERADEVRALHATTQKIRKARFGQASEIPSLRLMYQLDDENVPVERNIFQSSPAHELIEEISHKTNSLVAKKLYAGLPDKVLLRKHASPNPRRLQTFSERMTNIGHEVDVSTSSKLQSTLFKIQDKGIRQGMETLLVKAMQRAKYVTPGSAHAGGDLSHYALNLPLYTHFTNPSRRYADIIVHRQLAHVLTDGAVEFTEDVESLGKTAESCNTKKDSAQAAQEQSVHIESCRLMAQQSQELGRDLVSEGVVLCVYESAFDVLVPEYGFEKRVHCDQLPIRKAEFDKNKRVLELYWEKGVPSSTFVPEDERHEARRALSVSARKTSLARSEAGSDNMSDLADQAAGVSLNVKGLAEEGLKDKERYRKMFKLREDNGDLIQDVTEMTRVPVILKTDMTKSPP